MNSDQTCNERCQATPIEMRKPLRVIAVGDLSFNGDFRRILTERSAAFPFERVASAWRHADLRVGNLESPITTRARVAPAKFTLRAASHAADSLVAGKFDVVSLANNHMMDFGAEGMLDTCRQLDAAGIAHVGAGRNLKEAASPALITQGRLKIGVLAYCNVDQVSALYATEDAPGVAPFALDACVSAIRSLRPFVDRVIVHLHWGDEMSQLPSSTQRVQAACLAEAGADLILGHHPHVLQPIEQLGDSLVAYSLGDFLFSNAYWHGTGGSGKPFLAYYDQHPLSRRTGWLDVALRPDGPPLARFHSARLSRGMQVVRCEDRLFERQQARFEEIVSERRLDDAYEREKELAKRRERWRLSGKRLSTRMRLKLLRFGILGRAYIEPDDIDWKSLPF